MPPAPSIPKSFRGLLAGSVAATHGYLLGILSFILAAAAWAFPRPFPQPARVSFPVLLLFSLLAILACTVLFHASLTAFHFMRHPLPSVRSARVPPPYYSGVKALCFLDPSELFSNETLVSFYLLADGQYELLLGLGHVLTIQADGLIQVALTRVLPGYEAELERVCNSDSTLLKRIVVKPTVPRLELLLPEGSEPPTTEESDDRT